MDIIAVNNATGIAMRWRDNGDGTYSPVIAANTGATANQIQGTAADGSPAVGSPVQVGGKDGAGNAQTLATDTSGNVGVGTGTAGTAATNVATVQGIVGATPVIVGGAVASGAADSGNPLKVGGVYNSTAPTLATGQRGDAQLGTRGSMNVTLFSQDTNVSIGATSNHVDGLSVSPILNKLSVVSAGYAFNGTSLDRLRTVGGAANTTGVGIAAVGMALLSTSDLTRLVITNAAASGNTTLVAAVAAQTTRVHRLRLSVAGACIVKITDGAGGTVLETFNFAGNGGGVVLDLSDRPYYKTTANTALVLNVSAAVQVDGVLEYVTAA